MKEIFELAGLNSEAVSNHSLWATGISRLYAAGVPDKLIMERSGHLSAEGVHSYKRNTVQQEKAVSSLLSSPNKLFGDAMKPVPVLNSTGQQPELAIRMESPQEMKPPSDQGDPAVATELPPETKPPSDMDGMMLPEVKPQFEAEKVKEMFALSGCTVTFNMHFNH